MTPSSSEESANFRFRCVGAISNPYSSIASTTPPGEIDAAIPNPPRPTRPVARSLRPDERQPECIVVAEGSVRVNRGTGGGAGGSPAERFSQKSIALPATMSRS